MPEHKERPSIFNGEMIRAILHGRKTQTRRVLKNRLNDETPYKVVFQGRQHGKWLMRFGTRPVRDELNVACPFGVAGDRLWVRETWRLGGHYHDFTGKEIRETAEFGTNPMEEHVHYRAEESPKDDKWRSPYHMPRWASRIMLEITDVRVQRLQDISAEDAIAEGVNAPHIFPGVVSANSGGSFYTSDCEHGCGAWMGSSRSGPGLHGAFQACPTIAVEKLKELWDSLNAKRGYSWGSNPWVWAITFKRLGTT